MSLSAIDKIFARFTPKPEEIAIGLGYIARVTYEVRAADLTDWPNLIRVTATLSIPTATGTSQLPSDIVPGDGEPQVSVLGVNYDSNWGRYDAGYRHRAVVLEGDAFSVLLAKANAKIWQAIATIRDITSER